MTDRQRQAAARLRKALIEAPLPPVKGPIPGLPQTVVRRLTTPIVNRGTSYPWAGVALGDRFYGDGAVPKKRGGDDDSYLSTRDFDDWPSQVL